MIHICHVASGESPQQLENMLAPYGDYKVLDHPTINTDLIIGWSVSQMNKIFKYHQTHSDVPMVNYNWDVYEWVWDNPRPGEYDYKRYGELLKRSKEVWCPSQCTVNRTKEWYGVDAHVIRSSIPIYEHETRDDRFVLNPLRRIPDRNLDWFERACEELDIPYKSPNHELDQKEYRDMVASCSFIVSPYYEASTGGLTCMEGYYLGKPVLASNSPFLGLVDYLGDRAEYFQYDDFEDLKRKIKDMWDNPREVSDPEYIKRELSEEKMGALIHGRINALLK